jgi:hypothetical protein
MTEQLDNGSGKITYTVRELLAEIKATLSNIDSKLDNKAEKVVVENIEKRLSVMETQRISEREYGMQIFEDYKGLLKEHEQVKLDIAALKTNKKDKEAFNAMWIPIIFNTIGLFAGVIYGVITFHH